MITDPSKDVDYTDAVQERHTLLTWVRDMAEEIDQGTEILTRVAIDSLAYKGNKLVLEHDMVTSRDEDNT